jgi:CRP-like cAMP-binding protein
MKVFAMKNPLRLKAEHFIAFGDTDQLRLDDLVATAKRQTFGAREDILPEGKKVGHIHLVLHGLAARSKVLADGRRQIMAFLIPGDLCDVEVFVLEAMDHSIVAMSETTCALIPASTIKDLLIESSRLTTALWWSTMTDSAVLRERIIDHGRRGARERVAHLFYEMLIRNRAVCETADNSFPFPVTQEELSDATGMTPVHVNRMLKELRDDGLVDFSRGIVTVLDTKGLKQAAKFDATYLHFDRAEKHEGEVSRRTDDLL